MTLAQFHDQVLCPVFGYRRNYHSYAFRQYPDPWLGPAKSTSLDMSMVPLYVKALGDDRKVRLCHLLAEPGDCCTYVHDLGDWIEHVVRLDALHPPDSDGGGDGGGAGSAAVTAAADTAAAAAAAEGGGSSGGQDSGSSSSSSGGGGGGGGESGESGESGASENEKGAMTEAAATLLDGGNSSLPSDVGSASEYTGKLNMLIGFMGHADYHAKHTPGERRMLPPALDQWWTYLNDEFRKKNCSAIKFDAAGFDLEATRFDLDDCLRTPRSDPRQAHRLFLNNTMRGGGGHYDADANLDTASSEAGSGRSTKKKSKGGGSGSGAGGKQRRQQQQQQQQQQQNRTGNSCGGGSEGGNDVSGKECCAVCGSTAGLKACSRCRAVHYCSREHQLSHWKTHKAECVKADSGPGLGVD
jgi:hypothetical protein